MARTAIPGGLSARRAWRSATLADRRPETAQAVTLVLDVPDWPGHVPGQHVDVRLTSEDGYRATRSYSVAAPTDGDALELTVQRVPDGEVSTFLCDDLRRGDTVEVRGPLGGWFVWRPGQPGPVLLVAGGSGVVPLMSMLRARPAGSASPFRLVYSARSPEDLLYREELARRAAENDGVEVGLVFTRSAPEGDRRGVGRLRPEDLTGHGWSVDDAPTCYVCGPTGFVESAAAHLVALGHPPERIRTERFGPSGP
ncbi:oxidoreductase [Intrasporangium oryzae NRRL B-24470]|uniref:Oxidoreductase n=1 Tax=Intrasporangium oryzae NRRL B-24470 TaxID=1386089 RepID=W9G777_9MICO|nr:ferredoxin reductase [Intrasporangium oryzae]EWT01996.1 oxidoreductase [Intrasporangium oryzae NRRL B-24470]